MSKKSNVYVVRDTFVRQLDNGDIIDGDMAYDVNGQIVVDGVGYPGGVIKRLLDMGWPKEKIFIKAWIPLDKSN